MNKRAELLNMVGTASDVAVVEMYRSLRQAAEDKLTAFIASHKADLPIAVLADIYAKLTANTPTADTVPHAPVVFGPGEGANPPLDDLVNASRWINEDISVIADPTQPELDIAKLSNGRGPYNVKCKKDGAKGAKRVGLGDVTVGVDKVGVLRINICETVADALELHNKVHICTLHPQSNGSTLLMMLREDFLTHHASWYSRDDNNYKYNFVRALKPFGYYERNRLEPKIKTALFNFPKGFLHRQAAQYATEVAGIRSSRHDLMGCKIIVNGDFIRYSPIRLTSGDITSELPSAFKAWFTSCVAEKFYHSANGGDLVTLDRMVVGANTLHGHRRRHTPEEMAVGTDTRT